MRSAFLHEPRRHAFQHQALRNCYFTKSAEIIRIEQPRVDVRQ